MNPKYPYYINPSRLDISISNIEQSISVDEIQYVMNELIDLSNTYYVEDCFNLPLNVNNEHSADIYLDFDKEYNVAIFNNKILTYEHNIYSGVDDVSLYISCYFHKLLNNNSKLLDICEKIPTFNIEVNPDVYMVNDNIYIMSNFMGIIFSDYMISKNIIVMSTIKYDLDNSNDDYPYIIKQLNIMNLIESEYNSYVICNESIRNKK